MGLINYTSLKRQITVLGHEIIVTNKWRILPPFTESTLEIDGTIYARNKDWSHANPHIPLMSVKNVSPEIQNIDVFMIGVLSVKTAIAVNGKIVQKDDIDWLDQMQSDHFSTA